MVFDRDQDTNWNKITELELAAIIIDLIKIDSIFLAAIAALCLTMSVGSSVGGSVCLSVCLSVSMSCEVN